MQYSWGAWDAGWTWSIALIAITIAIHAVGVVAIAQAVGGFWAVGLRRRLDFLHRPSVAIGVIVAVALALAILHAAECLVWAIVYVHLGALASPADAVLYSVGSMTTRGSSGLVVAGQWRIMGATEAGNGMLLFGISTAFLFTIMQQSLWKSDSLKL
jgi:hypothetical protein